jgi:hypothetical protein
LAARARHYVEVLVAFVAFAALSHYQRLGRTAATATSRNEREARYRAIEGTNQPIESTPNTHEEAAAMRLQTHRDESRSRHFDLTGGGAHPWSIDLVAATASSILIVGFVSALVALWIH